MPLNKCTMPLYHSTAPSSSGVSLFGSEQQNHNFERHIRYRCEHTSYLKTSLKFGAHECHRPRCVCQGTMTYTDPLFVKLYKLKLSAKGVTRTKGVMSFCHYDDKVRERSLLLFNRLD